MNTGSRRALALGSLVLGGVLLGHPGDAQAQVVPSGWYAGDVHVHRSCGGPPESLASIKQKMDLNNLAAISLLADMGNGEVQDPDTDLPQVDGQDDPISTPGRIVHWDAEWHWECPIRCAECYNDPFAGIQVRMRLADSTMAWIEGDLAGRYTGAQPREGLPRTWQLPGVRNRMTLDLWWIYAPRQPDILSNGPLDPGVHGGKIIGWTTGTPKSPPQVVEAPFSVPVYLLDTTIAK